MRAASPGNQTRSFARSSTDGNTIAVADGLRPGERVAVNLPDEVVNGSRVQPITARR